MPKIMTTFHFELMTLLFKLRDLFFPRANVLREVGIRPGSHVLDFGCGPGHYVAPLAALVGASGIIYALDIHSRAIEKVSRLAERKKLYNVRTIQSDRETSLPMDSIDFVLLYDVFHMLEDQVAVLKELHRVLKTTGLLSFSDHHMKDREIVPRVTESGLFRLAGKGRKTYTFYKL